MFYKRRGSIIMSETKVVEFNKAEKPEVVNKSLFYGSLRPGCYNWDRGNRSSGMIDNGVTTISGYKMFSLGSYPFIIETGKEEDVITVNKIDITSQEKANGIAWMERGAGYTEKRVELDGEEYTLWVFGEEVINRIGDLSRFPHVEDGNWVEYIKEHGE